MNINKYLFFILQFNDLHLYLIKQVNPINHFILIHNILIMHHFLYSNIFITYINSFIFIKHLYYYQDEHYIIIYLIHDYKNVKQFLLIIFKQLPFLINQPLMLIIQELIHIILQQLQIILQMFLVFKYLLIHHNIILMFHDKYQLHINYFFLTFFPYLIFYLKIWFFYNYQQIYHIHLNYFLFF